MEVNMKLKDICKTYNFDYSHVFNFLRAKNFPFSVSPLGSAIVIDDKFVNEFVKIYTEHNDPNVNIAKRKALSEMLITSGFNFDGYKITKYSGYISGDDAISVERGMAFLGSAPNVKDMLMESLVTIRRNALNELKEAAYALGCNAVIGVDFDYLTLDPQTANFGGGTIYLPYVFGVTANGNAVIIEKDTE